MASRVIARELEELHARFEGARSGALADYIPELAKADPDWFGLSLCTIDGSLYGTGDHDRRFTIQSISKPFVYALALEDNGADTVLARIGVEPSGDAFNSVLLDRTDRPHNPMVNAGAIATVGLVGGDDPVERFERIREILGAFAGRPLEVDTAVYESERTTGHRNRAIAHLLRTAGAVDRDVEEVLDVYFRQCSVLVTSADLAVMGATLANRGVNPMTGRRVISPSVTADVLTVMYTAGMYDYSGEWAYRTGLPAKSGVSGGVTALIPDQAGFGVFSPLLDERGNSVRGLGICEELSSRLGFHMFRHRVDALPPIRAVSTGATRRSLRVRPLAESRVLDRVGGRIGVVEVQGPWSFVACERLMRLADDLDHEFLVIDTTRLGAVDSTAAALMHRLTRACEEDGSTVVMAGPLPESLAAFRPAAFPSTDAALEWCEDRLLASSDPVDTPVETWSLDRTDLGCGLEVGEVGRLERLGSERRLEPGDVLVAAGDSGRTMYLVRSGHLTATLGPRRVAAFGPGAIVGEMGFLTGDTRSARIAADEPTVVLAFELDGVDGDLMAKVHRNLAIVIADRLRSTNRALVDAWG